MRTRDASNPSSYPPAPELERPDREADRERPAARGRELELLAVVLVGQVLDREGQPDAVALAAQVDAPGEALHREAVEREQILRDQERRVEQRRAPRASTSVCVRTPYSTHQRPRGSVKRAAATTFNGVMLSAGVSSSD